MGVPEAMCAESLFGDGGGWLILREILGGGQSVEEMMMCSMRLWDMVLRYVVEPTLDRRSVIWSRLSPVCGVGSANDRWPTSSPGSQTLHTTSAHQESCNLSLFL
jgi:hypothetical protein